MESLGTMVSFFSQKVKEKVILVRELSLKHSTEAHGKRGPSDSSGLQTPASFGLKDGVSVAKTRPDDMKSSADFLCLFLSRRIARFDPWWGRSLKQVWSTSPGGQIQAAGRCCGCIDLCCG